MKREKSCGAIIFYLGENKPKILLIKHNQGGHWSFPKGHVEENETEIQTAMREIKEETGIDVSIDTRFREVVTYCPQKDVIKDVVYFFATTTDYEIHEQQEEVCGSKWVELRDASNCVTFKNDKELINKAIEFYTNIKEN